MNKKKRAHELIERYMPQTVTENDPPVRFATLKVYPKGTSGKKTQRHQIVEISRATAERLGLVPNQIAILINQERTLFHECTISIHTPGTPKVGPFTLEDDCIVLHHSLRLFFGIEEKNGGFPIYLMTQNPIVCSSIKVQSVEKLRDNIISVDPVTYDKVMSGGTRSVELRHLATGSTLTLTPSELEPDSSLKLGDIRLSYYIRSMLNVPSLNTIDPTRQEAVTQKLIDKIGRSNEQEDTDRYIDPNSKLLNGTYNAIQLFPVYEKYRTGNIFSHIRQWLSDLFVGKCELELSAVRPYQTDDSRDIVRLSKDNMALLGLAETDHVIIHYHSHSVRATVLAFNSNDDDSMDAVNILTSREAIDTIVGIPAPLREALDLGDVETEVRVKRDTGFLFAKNLDIQLLPLIFEFIALFQVEGMELWTKAVIGIVTAILIIYVMLSKERNKVKKRGLSLRKPARRSKKK